MPSTHTTQTALSALTALITTAQRTKVLAPAIDAAGFELKAILGRGGKILTAGNGGSAADALHMAEELVGRYSKERPAMAALSLCADPTTLTCIANDYGYNRVFARQVEGLGRSGDALVVFTTSGNSPNLIEALNTARERDLITFALLGKDGGKAKGLAHHELIVPGEDTARIQEIHTLILHSWLETIEG
jgi:D-sedoheptulose 7-phosphate isomerase